MKNLKKDIFVIKDALAPLQHALFSGYGDMVPVTHLGKGITMIFAVTGL